MPAAAFWAQTITSSVGTFTVALFVESPTDETPGVEVTGGSYARATPAWDYTDPFRIVTTQDVVFPGMPECTVVAVGLTIGAPGDEFGGLGYYEPLDAPRVIAEGEDAVIAAGDLTFTVQ